MNLQFGSKQHSSKFLAFSNKQPRCGFNIYTLPFSGHLDLHSFILSELDANNIKFLGKVLVEQQISLLNLRKQLPTGYPSFLHVPNYHSYRGMSCDESSVYCDYQHYTNECNLTQCFIHLSLKTGQFSFFHNSLFHVNVSLTRRRAISVMGGLLSLSGMLLKNGGLTWLL